MPIETEVIAGRLITPPCQGKVNHKPCHWPFTTKCGNMWLCRWCEQAYLARRLVQRVKKKLWRLKRRVT